MHFLTTDFTAELISTMVLILLGDGVVAGVLLTKSKAENSGWIVITAGWGFAVAMGVYVAGWVTGAHMNPAVTISLVTAGKLPVLEAIPYIGGQLLGAALGALLVFFAYRLHWDKTENPDHKLLVFCTMPAIKHHGWNFITEVIGTAMLMLGVLAISNKNNGLSSGASALSVGILIFAIGLSLGGPTGYAINPARDLMPRLMHYILPIKGKRNSGWSYAWVPVLGPIVGGIIGTGIYQFFLSNFWELTK